MTTTQQRPSSRLLIINPASEVLLFRFEHRKGPLAGEAFWSTPGGGLDDGENYEEAARRELLEEVGLRVEDPGPQIAQRLARFTGPAGESIEADERYFLIRAEEATVSRANWTELEHEVMAAHRWWGRMELRATADQIWPEGLEGMLVRAGVWAAPG